MNPLHALLMAIEQAHESALPVTHLADADESTGDYAAYEIPAAKWQKIVELYAHLKGTL